MVADKLAAKNNEALGMICSHPAIEIQVKSPSLGLSSIIECLDGSKNGRNAVVAYPKNWILSSGVELPPSWREVDKIMVKTVQEPDCPDVNPTHAAAGHKRKSPTLRVAQWFRLSQPAQSKGEISLEIQVRAEYEGFF
jgi:hypothetical protein